MYLFIHIPMIYNGSIIDINYISFCLVGGLLLAHSLQITQVLQRRLSDVQPKHWRPWAASSEPIDARCCPMGYGLVSSGPFTHLMISTFTY